jgi:hypothetical protein
MSVLHPAERLDGVPVGFATVYQATVARTQQDEILEVVALGVVIEGSHRRAPG